MNQPAANLPGSNSNVNRSSSKLIKCLQQTRQAVKVIGVKIVVVVAIVVVNELACSKSTRQ